MSLFTILTIIQGLIAAALVGVVLMQRSEGGGLGIGGSPGGALGARGAADFMSRATKWLAVAFVGFSILLAALAVSSASVSDVTTTLERDVAPGTGDLLGEPAAGAAAPTDDLLAEPGAAPVNPGDAPATAGEDTAPTGDDPLAE